jgi:hypothetical protein
MPPKFKKKKSSVKSARQNEASKVKAATKVTPLGLISFYSFSFYFANFDVFKPFCFGLAFGYPFSDAEKFENKLKPIASRTMRNQHGNGEAQAKRKR